MGRGRETKKNKFVGVQAHTRAFFYICIGKYTRNEKKEKKKKRVFGAYFSSFISPERKENAAAAEGHHHHQPPPHLPYPSFAAVV